MRGASRLLRRLSSVSSSALSGYSDTATRSLSTGTDLKNLLAEKIPEQQVRCCVCKVTSVRAITIHQLKSRKSQCVLPAGGERGWGG